MAIRGLVRLEDFEPRLIFTWLSLLKSLQIEAPQHIIVIYLWEGELSVNKEGEVGNGQG